MLKSVDEGDTKCRRADRREEATWGQSYGEIPYNPDVGTFKMHGSRIGVINFEVVSTTGVLRRAS